VRQAHTLRPTHQKKRDRSSSMRTTTQSCGHRRGHTAFD
jgi:hypothetical protein